MTRRVPALAATLAVLLFTLATAAPALAGGWAEIVADPAPADPPVAGQKAEIGFRVMQHGVTPAPWEQPTVHFTELAGGATFDVGARSTGDDGHFVATATIPTAGLWTWSVTLRDLGTEDVAFPLTVHTASGGMPTVDPALLLGAIDAARREAVTTSSGSLYAEVDRLDTELSTTRLLADRLQREVLAFQERLETAPAAGAATPATADGLPILAVVMISVLAGATAGFLMAWLAGRSGPRNVEVAFSPAPRGADPA